MSASVKIFEYVEGLHIDVPLTDSEGEDVANEVVSSSKFYVRRPGVTSEEEWATTMVAPNILRHTVPAGADLLPGRYRIQPYIETVDGYKGRCETVELELHKRFK